MPADTQSTTLLESPHSIVAENRCEERDTHGTDATNMCKSVRVRRVPTGASADNDTAEPVSPPSDAIDDSSTKGMGQAKDADSARDAILKFVDYHFAPTKHGTVSIKKSYLSSGQDLKAPSVENQYPSLGNPDSSAVEQDHAEQDSIALLLQRLQHDQKESDAPALHDRIDSDHALEEWACDTAEGTAMFFQVLLAEVVPVEPTAPAHSDVDACFDSFRTMLHGTTPAMFAERETVVINGFKTVDERTMAKGEWRAVMDSGVPRPGTFLSTAYLISCPPDAGASRFSLLAFEYLLGSAWGEKYLTGFLAQKTVRLPSIYEPHALRFLQLLEKTYLVGFEPRAKGVYEIYRKLAMPVHNQPAPNKVVQQARAGLMYGTNLDHEAALRLLIRGLWDSAHWTMKNGHLSEHWQNKRLSMEDRPDSPSAGTLLHRLSFELSDQRLGQDLRKMWSVLITDYLKAPFQFSDLVVSCVRDQSNIPPALEYLDLVPPPLLRDCIVAMSITTDEVQTVPQLGEKDLPFVHMWFKLLYRVHMRRMTDVEDAAALYQFAFTRFVRSHFEHRYPPSTLIAGLLYALAGHESFAGKLSLDLFDWIETYVLFLAQQDKAEPALNGLLAQLMSDLAKKSLPNHGVLELMIPHINEHKSFHSVTNLLERLPKSNTKLSDTKFLSNYADQVLEEVSNSQDSSRAGWNTRALKRFLKAHNAVHVNPGKSKSIVRELQSRRFFEHILARANDTHIVPLAYRNLTPDIPKEVQADLIHQFAYQYALDRTRSCQQNWRSIRYLYLYLKIHDLPIQPLFTRTVVSVCITRPLSENKFVAQKKAVWVCRLVAQVEGTDAARRVEQYFWAWRGDLILQAKRDLIELGEHDWAHVGMMERLKLLSWKPGYEARGSADVM